MLIQRSQLDAFKSFLLGMYGVNPLESKSPEVARFMLGESFFRLVEIGGDTLELLSSDRGRVKQIEESWFAHTAGAAYESLHDDHE